MNVPEDEKVYRYETHMHTSEGSKCGGSTGEEMARAYANAGYAGIIITDHFFNGNSAVPGNLPWDERVEGLFRGIENAAAVGRESGLSVFPGWEYNYCGTEFLTYGLGKEFLLDNPDMLDWDVVEYLERARDAGGLVSQAHPFRQRPYIQHTRLFYDHVDAVEVYNAGDREEWNDMARQYAEINDLAHTAGSDAHRMTQSPLSGLAFPCKLESIGDFVNAVKARAGMVIQDLRNPLAEVGP